MRQRPFDWVYVSSFSLRNGHLNISQHPRTCQTNAGKLPSEGAKSLDQPDWVKRNAAGLNTNIWAEAHGWIHHNHERGRIMENVYHCQRAQGNVSCYRCYPPIPCLSRKASIAWKKRWTGSLRNVKLCKEMLVIGRQYLYVYDNPLHGVRKWDLSVREECVQR